MLIAFACLWTTLTFSTREMLVLITKYKNNIVVFKRCMDDMLIIWRLNGACDNELE